MKKKLTIFLILMLVIMSFTACFKDSDDSGSSGSDGNQSQTSEDAEEMDDEDDEEGNPDGWDAADTYQPDEDMVYNGKTLQERLKYLKLDGWIQKGDSYVFTTDDEDCKGEYKISANGNDADLTVTFDYGGDNNEMIAFYKEDKDASRSICAYWYLRAAYVTSIEEGSVHYVLKVGNTKVIDDSMTYEDADDAYDTYFAD